VSAPRSIVLATNNPGKARELEALLGGLSLRLALVRDVCGAVDIAEPFATFRENAAYKARVAARLAGEWALGEDSGLAVDALAGRPGVYSARFAGKGEPDERRVGLLLGMLRGTPAPRRAARFCCAIALASPEGAVGEWQGVCEGRIAESARGEGGFGFDPVFIADGQTRTNAELTSDEKNAISHRGIAMRALARDLAGLLAQGKCGVMSAE
jgi:XTP/dITP diphosphohydrolase